MAHFGISLQTNGICKKRMKLAGIEHCISGPVAPGGSSTLEPLPQNYKILGTMIYIRKRWMYGWPLRKMRGKSIGNCDKRK